MLSKKLQRQLKKAFGSLEFDQDLQRMIEGLESGAAPTTETQLAVCKGLLEFFNLVDSSYSQSEKMLGITNRSLEISSKELNHSNSKLREMNRTVETMLANLGEGLKAAREIQQSLLPSMSQNLGSSSIEVLYRPAEELSGDFFDVFQHDDIITFYLADVTSHGTASAQVTYLIKGLFEEIVASNVRQGPASITKEFNRRYASYKLDYAVGVQVYQYYAQTNELRFCSSNSPSAYRIHSGAAEIVKAEPGPLIMASLFDPDKTFPERSTALSAGDTVYCLTDGALELNDSEKGQEFGVRAMAKILARAPENEWRDTVVTQLAAINGNEHFSDDITILRFRLNA